MLFAISLICPPVRFCSVEEEYRDAESLEMVTYMAMTHQIWSGVTYHLNTIVEGC